MMLSPRVTIAFVAGALCAGLATAHAQTPVKSRATSGKTRMILDRVVAVVNNAVILQSELNLRVTPMLGDLKAIKDPRARKRRAGKIARSVLNEMVNEELVIQAAVAAKLKVKAKEIRKTLDGIKKQNKLDDAGLAQALSMQGYTIASYKKEMRRQILRMRAINMLVRPKVRISKEDVRARYDAMNRRSAAVSKVRLHHVLIALPHKPTDVQVAAAKKKAAEVIRRAKAGEPFKQLALKYSDDPKTKADGGELGMIERGTIPTQWEVIVFAMEKNEVRGPISGPQGLHVFYVSEVEKRKVKAFKAVKQQLRNELYRKSLDRRTRSWLDDLRKKAHVRYVTN